MRTAIAICVIAVSAFFGPSAWAELHQIDQRQESQNYSCSVGGSTMMAQTFTPSLDGTLCHIQIGNMSGVSWDPMAKPVVEIRNTVEGTQGLQPGEYVWGTIPLDYVMPYQVDTGVMDPVSGEPIMSWITPDMTGSLGPAGWSPLIPFNIPVYADTTYSIVLGPSGNTGTVFVSGTVDDSYDRGALWAYDNDEWKPYTVGNIPVYDMQFRTYYIVPVPLPAGVWLGICAVGMAGWHLKRQKA